MHHVATRIVSDRRVFALDGEGLAWTPDIQRAHRFVDLSKAQLVARRDGHRGGSWPPDPRQPSLD